MAALVPVDDSLEKQICLNDTEVRKQLNSVVDSLEGGLAELVKIAAELKSLISTIDSVTQQVEMRCSIRQKSFHENDDDDNNNGKSHWDSNQNVSSINSRKGELGQVHWQTYASQDWFSGFKKYPRPTLLNRGDIGASAAIDVGYGSDSTLLREEDAMLLRENDVKYFEQVSAILAQIGKILNNLDGSNVRDGVATCRHVVDAGSDFPLCPLPSPPPTPRPQRKRTHQFPSVKPQSVNPWSVNPSPINPTPVNPSSICPPSVNLTPDNPSILNGSYEEEVDLILEGLHETDSYYIDDDCGMVSREPVQCESSSREGSIHNDSTIDTLQSYFD